MNKKADTMQKVHPNIKKHIDDQMSAIKFINSSEDGTDSLMI